jgi:transposase InsO family protein
VANLYGRDVYRTIIGLLSGAGWQASEAVWENGYCESINGKFRDQWLIGKLFYSLGEARVLIEQWRIHFNTLRPQQTIGKNHPLRAPGYPRPKRKRTCI